MREQTLIRLRCPSLGAHLAWLHEYPAWREVLDWKDALSLLREGKGRPPLLWIETLHVDRSLRTLLRTLEKEHPTTKVFLIAKTISTKDYIGLYKWDFIAHIGTPETRPETWKASIEKCLEEHALLKKQHHSMAASHNRNLRLVRLTHNLEQSVQRKTKKLFLSTKRLQKHEDQLETIKSLLVQINAAQDVRDIYLNLTKQLAFLVPYTELSIVIRDWSGRGYLAIKGTGAGDTTMDLLPARDEQLLDRTFDGLEPVIIHRQSTQKALLRSRLFMLQAHGSALFLPLTIGSEKGGIFIASHERTGFDPEIIQTLRHLQPPLSVALERVTTIGALNNLRYQWEVTFDAIPNPLFILSEDGRRTRTNLAADQLLREAPELERELESFGRQVPPILHCDSREFRVLASPFSYQEKTLLLIHLIEVTEEKNLLQRLLQTEKLASVGLLSEKVAHELNNPLAGIMALSQILQTDLEEPFRSDLKEIEKACRRCKHTIENLVEFSRPNTQKEKSPIQFNRAIEETLALARAGLTGIALEVQLASELPMIQGIFQDIQQVVFNLIQNASHAMHGKGSLSLKTHFDRRRQLVVFRIVDSGEGVPANLKEKIFEPFFTTKRAGVGTGLGLSICKKVVEDHHGTIRLVRSQPKEGTEFELCFPVLKG